MGSTILLLHRQQQSTQLGHLAVLDAGGVGIATPATPQVCSVFGVRALEQHYLRAFYTISKRAWQLTTEQVTSLTPSVYRTSQCSACLSASGICR